ncbi:allatotropins-like [Danaus plexippus]|uniref:allatotropins-like n=1 Tax=Danaus plexippus TaxID=13037 RepID=UPI002AB27C6A|nr:allatotropins-like [Danaus plexippus]
MNITVHLALVLVVLLSVESAPDGRFNRKQERPTRGLVNFNTLAARSFGKRDRIERDVNQQPPPERTNRGTPTFKSPSVGIARDYGKRTPDMESEDEPNRKKFHLKGPLMVATYYGKRTDNDYLREEEEEIRVTRGTFNPHSNVLIARGYGKRESRDEEHEPNNFWENLEASQDGDNGNDEKTVDSIPMDWFVNEMINSPDFVRSVVLKFIDLNQDGMLSAEELLRKY